MTHMHFHGCHYREPRVYHTLYAVTQLFQRVGGPDILLCGSFGVRMEDVHE